MKKQEKKIESVRYFGITKLLLLPFFLLLASSFYFLDTVSVSAQEGLTLSITPPLFQLNIGPGESWASSIKVVNVNPYDLTVYASPVNFEVSDEAGHSKFKPRLKTEEGLSATLANWITITSDPIVVPRGKSVNVPFLVDIPADAPPGGHYAAVLVGTEPAKGAASGATIEVTSMVTSLFFVRVRGDIKEEGLIREFHSERAFYDSANVDFTLRFENKGNVHLQPQGEIAIYNMWGKERGAIPVNQKTDFGNVLPQSIRKFSFTWEGESNFFEIGRYRAIATLTFGNENRQNVNATSFFWVIPVWPTVEILGSALLFILFVAWAIRRYIRRALQIQARLMGLRPAGLPTDGDDSLVRDSAIRTLARPLEEGALDLRRVGAEVFAPKTAQKIASADSVPREFVRKYYLFLVFVIIFIVGSIGLAFYFKEVFTSSRSFEIRIEKPDNRTITIKSEDGGQPAR